jgi:RNA polymerase-associated protein CTR9
LHYFRAVEFFCKAIKHEPRNAHAAAGIGIAFAETSKLADAAEVFNQVCELASGDPVFTLLAANALVANNLMNLAIPLVVLFLIQYESIIKKGGFKNRLEVLQSLMRAHFISGKSQRDETAIKAALKYAQKAMHISPSARSSLYNIAIVQQQVAHVQIDQPLDKRTIPDLKFAQHQLNLSIRLDFN